jgi:Flp pilus assembly protein TadG
MFGLSFLAQMCKRFRTSWRALAGDASGSMLPLAVGGLIVLLGLVGGTVDISQVYRVQNRLQAACDAGALAGRKAVSTPGVAGAFGTSQQAQANSYFNVNFDQAQQMVTSVTFTPSSPDNGVTVVGSATANVKMKVMMLFGMTSIPVTVSCQAKQGITNLDVTFVLDTTGSMGTILTGSATRLDSLKSAAKSFYSTIATMTSGTSARVRYAFVPFSAGVNVGSLLYAMNPAYLLDTYTVQSRVARFETANNAVFNSSGSYSYPLTEYVYASSGYNSTPAQYGTASFASLPACQAAQPADSPWANSGTVTYANNSTFPINNGWRTVAMSETLQPQTQTYYFCNRSGDLYYLYSYTATRSFNTYTYSTLTPTSTFNSTTFDHWDYRPVSYDMSTYKTGARVTTATGSNGGNVNSTWAGCIEERYTRSDASFGYDTTQGRITPTAAIDLDIDSAPTSDNATKWAPQWPQLAYYRTDNNGYMSSALLSASGSQASAYCPTGAKALATMTQTEFNTYVDSLNATGDTYHDFGMLWGARISSPSGMWASTVNAAPVNGQSVSRHLILETDGEPNAAYNIQQMYGIEYHDRRITDDGYTDDDTRHVARFQALCAAIKAKGIRIWVIATATALTSNLTSCASPNSAYTAASSSELTNAFTSIARQIGELRISQ